MNREKLKEIDVKIGTDTDRERDVMLEWIDAKIG